MIQRSNTNLDELKIQFEKSPAEGMNRAVTNLREIRQGKTLAEWKMLVKQIRQHSILDLVLQDPFICRAHLKPRGYPGDAKLLDMMYDENPYVDEPLSPVASGIFEYGMQSPAPVAVRDRRVVIAREIQQAAATWKSPQILSVACGHMRELDLVDTTDSRPQYVCLDQDLLSLQEVNRRYAQAHDVTTLPLSVKQLIGGKHDLGEFHLIYSAGLYDYFSQPMATRVTERLFQMLAPGGRLLIANFSPTVRDIGFMECFMDWWLTYRTESEMASLSAEIDPRLIASSHIEARSGGDMLFLSIQSK